MMFLFKIFFCIVCVEAATELLSKSEFFLFFRKFLFDNRQYKYIAFIHSVFDCPYCLSVWVSMVFVPFFYIMYSSNFHFIFMFIPVVLFFHRMSNILHFIIDRFRGI